MQLVVNVQLPHALGGLAAQAMYIGELHKQRQKMHRCTGHVIVEQQWDQAM
jgi:hypothetical protein